MPFTYCPLIRTKTGETTALRHLPTASRPRIFPVFQMTGKPPANFAASLIRAWSGSGISLDGQYNFGITGLTTDFQNLFRTLTNGGVSVVPSLEVDAPAPYAQAVQGLVAGARRRVVVRANLAHLSRATQWAQTLGFSTGDCDLLVYAGHVSDLGVDVYESVVVNLLTAAFPAARIPWRSIILCSSAAPKNMGTLNFGRNVVPRLDWELWTRVQRQVRFPLQYSDCAAGHPDLDEPPGVAMARATVSVRYTVDDNWIVLKGRQQGGVGGQPMATQYRSHAQTLAGDPQFGQLAGCWGDTRIQQIAAGSTTSGNRTSWVEIAANRHFSLVIDRLP